MWDSVYTRSKVWRPTGTAQQPVRPDRTGDAPMLHRADRGWLGGGRVSGLWLLLVALVVVALGSAGPAGAAGSSTVSFYHVYTPGWNLVAGPDGSRLAINREPLLSLNGTTDAYTVNHDASAQAGTGYWVFYPHGAVLLLAGAPQAVSQLHVAGGSWATIGNSGTKSVSVRGADIALTYTPQSGFVPADQVQPGQAALVFAYSDTDVYLDPYLPTPTRQSILPPPDQPAPPPVPALPQGLAAPTIDTSEATPIASPTDELNYLYAVSPVLSDVNTRLGDFADKIATADPAQPNDPFWSALRDDSAGVASDLRMLQGLTAPPRYTDVQADLVNSLADLSDGMRESIAGSLGATPDEVTVGAGLLSSGARRLTIALSRLPQ